MEEKHLVVVENINPVQLFSETKLMSDILSGIREKLNAFEGDVTTDAGRKEIAAMAYKVSRSKTFLDEFRKERIKNAKATIDRANGIWKLAKEKLDEWRDEIRKPLDEWETEQEKIKAEEARKEQERIQARIDAFSKYNCQIAFFDAAAMSDEEFEIALNKAVVVYEQEQAKIAEQEEKERIAREAEEKRLAEVKAKQERIAKEQAEKEAALKAEQAKIDSERKAIEEEKRLEQEKKDAAEKASKEAAEAEIRKKAEQDRLEALKPDREKILQYAVKLESAELIPDVDTDEAEELLIEFNEKLIVLTGWLKKEAQAL